MARNNKVELKRVSINLPKDLVQRVEEYGEMKGLNTTSAFIILLNQALDAKDTIDNLPYLIELLKSEISKNQSLNFENNDLK